MFKSVSFQQVVSGHPWFDKLTMTTVTLSLSKGGFPGQAGMTEKQKLIEFIHKL
jgi:hypothetical protein